MRLCRVAAASSSTPLGFLTETDGNKRERKRGRSETQETTELEGRWTDLTKDFSLFAGV